jgi:hypothetical protein
MLSVANQFYTLSACPTWGLKWLRIEQLGILNKKSLDLQDTQKCFKKGEGRGLNTWDF